MGSTSGSSSPSVSLSSSGLSANGSGSNPWRSSSSKDAESSPKSHPNFVSGKTYVSVRVGIKIDLITGLPVKYPISFLRATILLALCSEIPRSEGAVRKTNGDRVILVIKLNGFLDPNNFW